ncbi:MAG: glycerol-3-phosphate 1-O-acyltransferase PlsY [Bacteroidota bacterium]
MEFDFINYQTVLVCILAYLIGSIPTAVWVGKWFYKIDVRDYGSGNAGATNTIRVLGPKAGIPVFIIDVLKGFSAVELAYICRDDFGTHNEFFAFFKVILSFIVVVGHVFPLFAGFKGGKGIATSLGVVLALFPFPALITFGIFMIVLLITHYVSIGSMAASIIFPFLSYYVFDCNEWAYIVFSITVVIFIFFTHRKNIRRLRKGEEAKFFFRKKKPLISK